MGASLCVVGDLLVAACGSEPLRMVGGRVGGRGPLEVVGPCQEVLDHALQSLLSEHHLGGHRGDLHLDQHSVGVGSCSGPRTGAVPAR